MTKEYIGSVRFYKNIILLVVVLSIGISVGLAIYNGQRATNAEKKLQMIQQGTGEQAFKQVSDCAPDYQLLYPDFYAEDAYAAGEREAGVAYLTFESDPSKSTDDILAILREQEVKATFFVSGTGAGTALYDARLLNILNDGHTLGMYSWCSDYLMVYKSVESYLADMYTLFSYIKNVTGVTPTVFRFLGGSVNAYNTEIYQQLVAEMIRRGFVPCDWNVSCGNGNAEAMAETLKRDVDGNVSVLDRAVIQLRDCVDKTATVQALPEIIDALRRDDYRFEALTPETKPVSFSYLT